jgi:PIN domain nuclease of toxin-antitoxin system
MRLLLDTQALLLLSGKPEQVQSVPRNVRELVADSEHDLYLSSVSVGELALKNSIGKLRIDAQSVRQALRALDIKIIPFATRHAMELFDLPLHHKDPFDRHIIATALSEGIPLVGGDRQFGQYAGLQVIW